MDALARRLSVLLALAALAALAIAATGTAAPGRQAAGTLLFCTDATYPPEEFYEGTKLVGSDIDIGTEVARRLGMTAKFQNTGFDGIIAALIAKKCDAIISGMNDTPERRKQVAFVDYISVGQSLMVKKGNPKGIKTLASLSGHSVSVEVGTTNKAFLDKTSADLQKKGKPAIKVVTFPKDTDAANALKTGRVDAYYGDAPVVAYYIERDKSFAFAGSPINPIPVGMAFRKGDPLIPKVRRQVRAMYADGKMASILAKWKMSSVSLKNA